MILGELEKEPEIDQNEKNHRKSGNKTQVFGCTVCVYMSIRLFIMERDQEGFFIQGWTDRVHGLVDDTKNLSVQIKAIMTKFNEPEPMQCVVGCCSQKKQFRGSFTLLPGVY